MKKEEKKEEAGKKDDGGKKDFSTAILDSKKAPNRLLVEEAKTDDNSIVEMAQAKMDELKIYKGDTVLLRGSREFDSAREEAKGQRGDRSNCGREG